MSDRIAEFLPVSSYQRGLVVAVHDRPRVVPIGDLVGEELGELFAREVAVDHAPNDDLECDPGLEGPVSVLDKRALQRQLRVLALVVVFPRQLHVPAAVVRLTRLRVRYTVLLALALPVFGNRLHCGSSFVISSGQDIRKHSIVEVVALGNRRVFVVIPVQKHVQTVNLPLVELLEEVVLDVIEEIFSMNGHRATSPPPVYRDTPRRSRAARISSREKEAPGDRLARGKTPTPRAGPSIEGPCPGRAMLR